MSFSSLVKNELCRHEVKEKCCMLSEIAAVAEIGANSASIKGNNDLLRIVTENAAFARRVFSLIKQLYGIFPRVVIRKTQKLKKHTYYILTVSDFLDVQGIKTQKRDDNYLRVISHKECCKKAYLRGAFLSGGSVSDPEKTYHLEIAVHNKELAIELNNLINSYELNSKIIKRKGNYVTYLKEGENIVDFLNIIGAHSALMELENIRILKEMRNNVNRIVNCETANLEKTVHASLRQIENIKYIRDTIGFDNLPPNLREIAELRLKYSDLSLKELGEMLSPSLGKSGVNHRLRKLDNIAEERRLLRE